ncbi:MAG TPA: thermonuclease family protein [Nostocaceae cyanobacterium]|nr:thermonuclease family protein [Nostocaceae cyanobacterium]
MFSRFTPLVSAALALMLISPSDAQLTTAKVVSVKDGDTIFIQAGSKKVEVRLACIDTPEKGQQPYYKQATDRLKQILPANQSIQVRSIETDKYKRLVAEIYLNGRSVNLQMVQEGQAVVYRQYLKACDSTKNQYLQAEATAKSQKLGFWKQPNPVTPSDFRRGKTTPSTPRPVSSPTTQAKQCDSSYPDFCLKPNIPDLNCGDISYRRFKVLPPDPHGFDGDGDGVGCER